MKAIKGFDANLQCRGFQFEVGKTYRHDGEVKACKSGFHAIPDDHHPFAVFNYYPPSGSRFCVVEIDGATDLDADKVAAEILHVQREIGLHVLIDEAVKWVTDRAKPTGAASNSGYRGAASNSGYQGAASNSGTRGAASNSGNYGAASNSGSYGAASNSGTQGAASNSGTRGAAADFSGSGMVMGITGSALFALERDGDGKIISTASGIVGESGLKPDAWYRCRGGKFVEVGK